MLLPAERIDAPRFSVVTWVDEDASSTDDLMASIDAQRVDARRIEVIVVDRRPTAARTPFPASRPASARRAGVTVLTHPAGSRAAARNIGLDRATGDWVVFADPWHRLDRECLWAIDRFDAAHPDAVLLAARPVKPTSGRRRAWDALASASEWDRGDSLVDLLDEPERLPTVGTGCLYRLSRIRDWGLTFDPAIGPELADACFAGRYLLAADRPVIGILRGARYGIGTAPRGGPTGASRGDPACRTDVLLTGLLDLMNEARGRDGSVPAWVQHLVIDRLASYLAADEPITTRIHIPADLLPEFHDQFAHIVTDLDPDVVATHGARPLRSAWADILAHGYRATAWRSAVVARTKIDQPAGLQRVSYRYTGAPPLEAFLVDGRPVEPVTGKTMGHIYYGRALMWERIAWLPAGPLEVRVDGVRRPIVGRWADPRSLTRPRSLAGWIGLTRTTPTRRLLRAATRRIVKLGYRVASTPVRVVARLPRYRSSFRHAWVLMDRVFNADDNGERLFEYLRANRPDINAWFVIERGTPDWDRLHSADRSRLVAYGSFRWLMLMLNCSWVVSSHGSRAVAAPPKVIHITGRPTWRYAFLQHGVTKDDISKWVNKRDADLFVVSTIPELESVVADGTGYRYTTREARNTGLPRFDRLLAKGGAVPPDDRDLVIVAPTWRMWLTNAPDTRMDRPVDGDTFWSSRYLREWMAILRSPDLARAAERHGRRIVFMPHPNMQAMLPQIDLPPHVEPIAFEGNDVQSIYARCALLVTDYSSVAFNAAFLDRPVVYFQFDRDIVMAGGHLGRKGYFEYELDGFGPVVTEQAAAIDAIVAAIEHGPAPTPAFQARIDRTFVDRDGQACARVVDAIESLDRPYVPLDPGAALAGRTSAGPTGGSDA